MTSNFAITSIDVALPLLGEKRLNFAPKDDKSSHITVLVGRNGTGKSTILREITMSFRQYFASQKLRSRQGLESIYAIDVSRNGQTRSLNLKLDAKQFRTDRDEVRAADLAPAKLIALSFTPFDKFPPADDTRFLSETDSKKPFYVYLGFKSEFRMTPRGKLLRSIDQLVFDASAKASDTRVEEAFSAIGYAPVLRLSYELAQSPGSARFNDRSRELEPQARDLLERLSSSALPDPREKAPALSFAIDFSRRDPDSALHRDFEEIRDLTRQNALRLTSITLERLNGGEVELLELSSGELNLLSGFLGLAAFLEDGCLVLIDEPENSLHPEWQLRYVEMLEAVLSRYSGCHYIVATHSPLIVSGVAGRRATVLRLDQEPVEVSPESIMNASPDATLLNAFKVVTAGNNFLKQLVLEALTLIETGQHRKQRAREIATFLASLYEQMPDHDPLKRLVASVVPTIIRRP